MFKVGKAEPTAIHWPCTINIPRDGGGSTKARCTIEFELIEQTEIDEILGGGGDRDLLDRVVRGWGADVTDAEGNPLPFTPENKARVLAITYARAGIVAGFFEAASGGARRKN
ncbi:MAG: hypothetical protein IT529_21820 [Burkholderiales bacterium]|nr:hypothetical protein [Burkholderiales bacterium]